MTKRYKNFLLDFEPQELRVVGNKIYISDFIDSDWGVSGDMVLEALMNFEDDMEVDVVINSPGGSVFEGIAITNAIKDRPMTNTIISGVAASIASVIAMAGDKVSMHANSILMIHKPSSIVLGTAEDFKKEAEVLDKIQNGMLVPSYARTGLSEKRLNEMIDAETWLTAKEARANNFVDKVLDKQSDPAVKASKLNRNLRNYLNNLRQRAIKSRE